MYGSYRPKNPVRSIGHTSKYSFPTVDDIHGFFISSLIRRAWNKLSTNLHFQILAFNLPTALHGSGLPVSTAHIGQAARDSSGHQSCTGEPLQIQLPRALLVLHAVLGQPGYARLWRSALRWADLSLPVAAALPGLCAQIQGGADVAQFGGIFHRFRHQWVSVGMLEQNRNRKRSAPPTAGKKFLMRFGVLLDFKLA